MTDDNRVWARLVVAVNDGLLHEGLSTKGLFDDLSFDASTVQRMRWVRWDEYGIICERAAEITGGGDSIADFLESGYHQTFPDLRMVAGAFLEPKPILKFLFEVINPRAFLPLTLSYEDLGGDRFRIEQRLKPGMRPCEAYFVGSTGAVRGFSRHLDLPPISLSHVDVGPDHGVYEGAVPKSRTILRRATRVSRDLLGRTLGRLFVEVNEGQKEESESEIGLDDTRMNHVVVAWELTPRQVDVLRLLVRGQSNKEIAQALSCADNTVELHVTQLLKKAHVTSRTQLIARFWSGE